METNKKIDVVCIGDALLEHQYYIDEMPTAGQDVRILSGVSGSGGSAANTAIMLGRLGALTAFIGSVGRECENSEPITLLKKANVDVSAVEFCDIPTGYTVVMIDKNSERTMFSFRGAAAVVPKITENLRQKLINSKVVLVSGYMLQGETQAKFVLECAKIARSEGGLVAFDPSPVIGIIERKIRKEMLALTDIFLPNLDELKQVTGCDEPDDAAESLDINIVAVKLGAKGSVVFCDDEKKTKISMPAQRLVPLDTTGAGDAFNAGFLSGIVRELGLDECLKLGNETAAKIVMSYGATGEAINN